MCFDLAQVLTARGHEVTLIGVGRNHSNARFVATYAMPPSGLGTAGGMIHELTHAAKAARTIEAVEPDVVHDHSLAGPLTATRRPTVVTVHGPVGASAGAFYRDLAPSVHLTALSWAQRRQAPDLRWAGVVYNGIRVDAYPFSSRKEPYLLFLGRMSPDKGAHLAIDVARAVGMRLIIAAKCTEPAEERYFEERIRPSLGRDIEWVGEAEAEEKRRLLIGARCLLSPVQWEEPFGLVLVEALACGTPVVALRRGSVPEVVVDGVTGFVRDRPDELAEAVRHTDEIDPFACRRDVERRFSVDRMVTGYEQIYRRLLGDRSPDREIPIAEAVAR